MAGELGSISGQITIDYDSGGVDKAEQDVGGLEKKSRRTTAAIAGFFGGMAASITAEVGKMALAVGASMVSGIQDAVIGTEKSRDRLQAQLGDVDWAGKAGKAAGSLYRDAWGESLQEVNDAVRAVLQGGLLGGDATQKEIEGITSKVIDLSDAFDQDVNSTVRASTQLVRTGLAKDGGAAIDLLTRGFQLTGDLAGDLLDTFNEYGTQFRKLGIDGETALGLINQGLQAGARDTDVVADAIKEFSIRAVDGSEATADGFKAIGLNAKEMTNLIAQGGPEASEGLQTVLDRLREMEDPVKRDAAAVALFGTQSEDLGEALLALDPSTATKSLGEVEGAAGKLSDTLNQGAGVQLEAFKRQVREALTRRLAQAIPTIRKVFGVLQEAFVWLDTNALPILKSVGQFIEDNKTPILVIAGVIAAVYIPHWIALGVAATVNAAKTVVAWTVMQARAIASGAIHSAQIVIMIARWTALGAVATASAARAAAAWVAATAGAAAAGAATALATARMIAYNAAALIVRGATVAWTAVQWLLNAALTANPIGIIVVAIGALVAAIIYIATQTTIFQDIWAWVWERIGGVVTTVFKFIKGVFDFYLNVLITFWTTVWNTAVTIFQFVWKLIVGYVKLYIKIVTTVIKTAIAVIKAVWSAAWNFVRNAIEVVFKAIRKIVTTYVNIWKKIITTALNVIKSVWKAAWNTAKSVVTTIINAIRSVIQSVINRIKGIIKGISEIVGTVRNAFSRAREAAVSRLKSLISYVKGIPGRIKSALGNLKSRLFSAGQDIIRGLINGIKNMAGQAASAAVDAVKGALNSAKDFLGIGSPSKRFQKEVGQPISQGTARGIDDDSKLVNASIRALVDGALKTANDSLKQTKTKTTSLPHPKSKSYSRGEFTDREWKALMSGGLPAYMRLWDASFGGRASDAMRERERKRVANTLAVLGRASDSRDMDTFLRSTAGGPSSSVVAASTIAAAARGGDGVTYSFAPGSITLDASKLKSIDDLVRMVDNLQPTARQFVRK